MTRVEFRALLFCNLLSMQYHPGFTKPGSERLSYASMLGIVDRAATAFEERFEVEEEV